MNYNHLNLKNGNEYIKYLETKTKEQKQTIHDLLESIHNLTTIITRQTIKINDPKNNSELIEKLKEVPK